ncbi:MAG: ABC transporter permease [Polaribacter sp.]|nr:MAG: ABC transporter permease [Polaribacter sp.]
MTKFTKHIHYHSDAFIKSMVWEYKLILKDKAVFFSFIGVALIVSFLYSYIYSNEILTNLPVAVVDMDNSTHSRQLLRMVDASEQVHLNQKYPQISDAEKAFNKNEVRGIIIIPNDFSRKLQRGEQPAISVYADASYMLYYKQIVTAIQKTVGYMNAGVQLKKTMANRKSTEQAKDNVLAIRGKTVNLFNPSSGYATFLIPIVLIIIFQTTILTSIGILVGTMTENKLFSRLYPHSDEFLGTLPIVMGKATTYLLMGIAILLVMTTIVMPLFNIPMRTSILNVIVYLFPFLLSLVYLGIFLTGFFKKREDAILLIMFTSIPSLLLTGYSWPTTATPIWIQVLSYFIPSTLGSKGFVSLTQMGADFSVVKSYWLMQWALCLFYLTLAVLTYKRMYLAERIGKTKI